MKGGTIQLLSTSMTKTEYIKSEPINIESRKDLVIALAEMDILNEHGWIDELNEIEKKENMKGGKKILECVHCQKNYTYLKNLRNHINKKHK